MINWISTINYIYKLKINDQSNRIKRFQSRYSATVYNMDWSLSEAFYWCSKLTAAIEP